MDSRKLALNEMERAISVRRLKHIIGLMEDQWRQLAQAKPKREEKKSA